MSVVKIEKQAAPYVIVLKTEPDVVKALMEAEFETFKDKINVKGYRKGQAPRNVVEAQKGFDKFTYYRETIMKCFEAGVKETGLQLVNYTNLSILGEFSDKTPLVIRATVHVLPKVLSFSIADLKVGAPVVDVTDGMVSEKIESMMKEKQSFNQSVDNGYAMKKGDAIFIDFLGSIDGKPFQGGAAKNFKYTVGETNFIPGFESQLLNMKLGEKSVIRVPFPDDYHKEDLKGKVADFDVTVHAIHEVKRPTLQDLAAADSQDEATFVATVKNKLIEDTAKTNAEQLKSLIIKKALEVTNVEPIMDELVNVELDSEWNRTLQRMGMTEDQVKKQGMMSKEQFYGMKREDAALHVKTKILLGHIAAEEKLEVSEEDVKAFMTRNSGGLEGAELEAFLTENMNDEASKSFVLNTLKQEKAMDWLFDNATVE